MVEETYIKGILKEFKPKSYKIDLYDSNLQEISNRYFVFNDKNDNRFKLFLFTKRLSLEIKLNTNLLFAVNLPDNVCLANQKLDSTVSDYKIFTDHKKDELVTDCTNLIQEELGSLKLMLGEGLFVYGNLIQIILNPTRLIIPEIEILNRIRLKLSDKCSINEKIDFSNLPVNLQQLIPILNEWAIPDEAEREEKIAKTSPKKLKQLIDRVNPKMDAINDYLDNFKKDALPHEATLVGNLAELITELNNEND